MTRNIVRVSFGILLVFGLSLSISIDHRVLSKTERNRWNLVCQCQNQSGLRWKSVLLLIWYLSWWREF